MALGTVLGSLPEVHAMMDVSDGVASDLMHILNASGVGAEVELDKIPMSEEMVTLCQTNGWNPLSLALEGGEDYCLLFTASADIRDEIMARTRSKIYCIGQLTDQFKGFTHF